MCFKKNGFKQGNNEKDTRWGRPLLMMLRGLIVGC